MNSISRRGLVRIISYISACILVLAAFALLSHNRAKSAELKLEYSYMRAVEDLSDHMNSIDSTLTKGKYAKTAPMLESLANKLKADTQGAKNCMSQLPINALHLEHTYEFLSQLGEYALSLSNKVEKGEQLTAEEMKNMEKLGEYSQRLREEVQYLEDSVQTGTTSFREIAARLEHSDLGTEEMPTFTDGFKEYEEGFSDFPSLIYDGPFSDHLMQREPRMLKDKKEVTRSQARKTALSLTGISEDILKDIGDDGGKMPAYNFTADGVDISISKAGGYPIYYLKYRDVSEEETISKEEAVKAARKYLEKMGYGSLTESYYELIGNVMTINFAYLDDDVTVYTDLIKVNVAMDNGEVLAVDARGFLTNHTDRKIQAPKLTVKQAQESVSDNLTVKSKKLAIIPSNSLEEKLCYEFYCTGKDGEDILVYVNADTGEEEEILILLIGENGTLTI